MREGQRLQTPWRWSVVSAGLIALTTSCSQDPGVSTTPQQASPTGPVAANSGNQAPASSAGRSANLAGASAAPTAGATQTTRTPAAGQSAPASAGESAPASVAGASAAPIAGSTGGSTPAEAGAPAGAAGVGGNAEGSAGAGGALATAGAGGSGVPTIDWSMRMDEGKGDGSDVVTIGDSWMDYVLGGGGIEAALDRAGTKYRHYGLSATTLLSGQIPGQYTRAKNVNPKILTVIMTGGGNDIMFSGGCNTTEACEASIAMLQKGLDELWTQMAADGVKDVIYIQYSADAGTAPRNTRPKETKPVPICLTGKIHCHSLATTELVMGDLVDGIHPTSRANDRIAKALLELMEARKMRR